MSNKLQTLISIDKPTAEKLFEKGFTIHLCANKLDVAAENVYPYPATKKPAQPEETLEAQAMGYAKYCCNARTGMKVKYYIAQ